MAEGFWNQQQAPISKRPRSDYDFPPSGAPSGPEMLNYLPRDDNRGRPQATIDTQSIGSAYDRYLQKSQAPSLGSGEVGGGSILGEPPMISGGPGAYNSNIPSNGRPMGYGGSPPMDSMARPGREMISLPPDASSTLFIEGLPSDCTRREVSRILWSNRGGNPIILCFVDFMDPPCAASAWRTLQGYKMDEHEHNSRILNLQFARNPPRSGSGPRGKR
ncbi:hypothetical protein GIB67_018310 [Kingdonia uniflora]|uniref:RRM domain-containing protein n=1 Tax=Kingdonia uniflora TaxID=39325 RepID=A0A7J7MJ03_9MAGN|nr:hypothetical protein GIB67_018310 [Kingdonia uniflora]